jgi:hypothetical protein
VRCGHSLERAFKAVDLILHAGGFGFIALNLCNVPAKTVRRVISSWWFRFRRAIEDTPTVLIVLTPVAAVRSCAALVLQLQNERSVWPSTLSLVFEKSNSSFTTYTIDRRTSFISAYNHCERGILPKTHAHFLHETEIVVNRERPVRNSSWTSEIHSSPPLWLTLRYSVIFGNIRSQPSKTKFHLFPALRRHVCLHLQPKCPEIPAKSGK